MTMVKQNPFRPSEDMLSYLKELGLRDGGGVGKSAPAQPATEGPSFLDHLKEGVKEVNTINKDADAKAMDLATGREENIHETMLRMTQADLSFNLMVQVRNKVLEAYQEVMRMPV